MAQTESDLTRPVACSIVRHCPKCGSVRVHRSRRRGVFEALLDSLGAEIQRCHDCRARRAWFGVTPLRLSGTSGESSSLTSLLLFAAGSLACVVLVWWMISRYTDLSG